MPLMIQRLIPLVIAAAAALALAGCEPGLPGSRSGPDDVVTPNAVTGETIEVTALDAPAPTGTEIAATGVPDPVADASADPAASAAGEPAAEPSIKPTDPAAAVAAEAAPPAPKSPEALACEKKGGDWSGTGLGSLRTCVFPTRDGGKRCTRQSDCDSLCLARSGTCSPIKPLLGCNDILQDNGVRATLCIR